MDTRSTQEACVDAGWSERGTRADGRPSAGGYVSARVRTPHTEEEDEGWWLLAEATQSLRRPCSSNAPTKARDLHNLDGLPRNKTSTGQSDTPEISMFHPIPIHTCTVSFAVSVFCFKNTKSDWNLLVHLRVDRTLKVLMKHVDSSRSPTVCPCPQMRQSVCSLC